MLQNSDDRIRAGGNENFGRGGYSNKRYGSVCYPEQALDLCELYEKVSKESGKHPKFYISHITGIYDEYLKEVAERDNIDISPDILWQAGMVIARKLYKIYKDRGYTVTFIGGGARGTHHFTEMVGGDVCITINWKGTADKLLDINRLLWRG